MAFLRKMRVMLIVSVIFLMSNVAQAGSATLAWNANSDVDLDGYKIYYGTSARTNSCPTGGYASSVDVGNVTSYTLSNLIDGQTYYFSITAHDNYNNESCFSSEVSKAIPAATAVSSNSSNSNDSHSSSKKKKKKKKSSPKRSISQSKSSVKRGAVLIQRGKKFSKNNYVLVYFSRPGGGYYAPSRIRTSASGAFSISARITKSVGKYSWYAVDVATGKKSKTKTYKVR